MEDRVDVINQRTTARANSAQPRKDTLLPPGSPIDSAFVNLFSSIEDAKDVFNQLSLRVLPVCNDAMLNKPTNPEEHPTGTSGLETRLINARVEIEKLVKDMRELRDCIEL